jgi:hypothetical protein
MSGEHTAEPGEAAIKAAAYAMLKHDPVFMKMLESSEAFELARAALVAAIPETAAECDHLRAELTAETRRAEDAHGEAQRWALQVEALRAEKAELVAALEGYIRLFDTMANGLEVSPGELFTAREKMRSCIAKATTAEGGGDDGADPTTTKLLKPRGNGGVVSPDICFDALLLVGDVDTQGIAPDSWTQAERDRAYDWAIRVHLHASDYDDVPVPPRPHYIPKAMATEGGE